MRSQLVAFSVTIILALLVIFFWGGQSYTVSTDFGLHYAVLQHISQHFAWPSEVLPNLEEMSFYPPMAHTLGAVAGYLTGSPVTGMTMVSLLSVFGSYVALLNLVRFKSSIETLAAITTFLFVIAAFHHLNIFVGGEIIQNFFYPQIVSFFLVLVLIAIFFSGHVAPVPLAISAIAITFGLGWVFPMATMQFACATLAYFGIATLKGLTSKDRRASLLNGSLLAALAFTLPAAIELHPTFQLIKAIAAWQGGIMLNVPVNQVPVILLICSLPIAVLAILYLRGNLRGVARPIALVTTAGGIFGAALAQILALKLGLGSSYGITKHVFPVVTMGTAVSSVLIVNTFSSWLGRQRSEYAALDGIVVACGAFVAFAVIFSTPGRSLAPLVETQKFIVSNAPADAVGRTVSLDRNLLPFENFALSLGDLAYPKKAAAVRILGPQVLNGYYDILGQKKTESYSAEKVLAEAPLSYYVINSDSVPKPDGACIASSSPRINAEFIRAPCLDTDVNYSLGKTIEIRHLRGDRPFLRKGWSTVEQFGVWSDGPTAVLVLPLSEAPKGALVLDVDATAYLSEATPIQRIEVVVGGQKVGEWVFSAQQQGNQRSVSIPASAMPRSGEITFHMLDAISPPGDARNIALGLKSFKLYERPAAPK
jgi:hypothetical protein